MMKPKSGVDAKAIVKMLENMRDEYHDMKIKHQKIGNGYGVSACAHRELLLDVILSKIAE